MISARNPDKQSHIAHISYLMAHTLGEPPQAARRLAIRWADAMQGIKRTWAVAAQMELEAALAANAPLHTADMKRLFAYLSDDPRGVLLTTIHMGDYLQALFALAYGLRERPMCIVRRREASDEEDNVFRKLREAGLRVHVQRTGERGSALRIIRHLSRGGMAVMLFDLPVIFGETGRFTFFEHAVDWVKGPFVCAARAGALLVPFISYYTPAVRCDLLHVHAFGGDEQAALIVGQQLVTTAQTYIRRYPEQWYHWHLLPDMLADADG